MTHRPLAGRVRDLIDECQVEAFRLELRDDYASSAEREALDRWRRGARDPADTQASTMGGWLETVRHATSRGCPVRRVRVVTEPASDYVRFEATTVPLQAEAGEDIRYLPRHHPAVPDLPGHDFWLLDDQVVILAFTEDGTPGPHQLDDDPAAVERHRQWRDVAWRHAIPYAAYAAHLE